MASLKGYRTFITLAATGILDTGVFGTLLAVDWQSAGFSPQVAVWIALGLSLTQKLIMVGLRMATTTPAFKSEPALDEAASAIKASALETTRYQYGPDPRA